MSEQFDNPNFFSVGAAVSAKLEADFERLLGKFSGDAAKIGETTRFVVAKYAEKNRFYHNLSHVAALLFAAENFGEDSADDESVRLAIWFHDAVYDPKRSDNETESAKLAIENLRALGAPAATVKKTAKMITATQKHDAAGLDGDGKRFLDLDLMILGAEAEFYRNYRRAIRREYSFVPWFLYRRRRALILANFLKRDAIYLTDELREKFETRARENIANELKELS